jgi:uncharacterized protein (TIGR03437 family)
VYYISPSQVNILTPPDAISGLVPVVVGNNGSTAAAFTAIANPTSASFFVFGGGPYVAAVHTGGGLVGTGTPAKPGETIMIYANGFGPTDTPVASGAVTQSGNLTPKPVVQIGGVTATVEFAGLVYPGEFQFNVVVPPTLTNGDQPITATYGGLPTPSGTLLPVHN